MIRAATHNATRWQRKQCDCATCETAYKTAQKRQAENRHERLRADPTIRPHGDHSTYTNWGCRCDDCCLVWSKRMARRKRSRGTPFVDTVRRGRKPSIEPIGREWLA